MKRTNFSSQFIPCDDDALDDEATLNRARFQILHQLSQMYEEPEEVIKDFALEAAVKMTRSKIGYIFFMNENETMLSLHVCYVPMRCNGTTNRIPGGRHRLMGRGCPAAPPHHHQRLQRPQPAQKGNTARARANHQTHEPAPD